MKNKLEALKAFHTTFNIAYENQPKANIEPEKYKLRFKLMQEENQEYLKAAEAKDLVEIADALGDMLYVLCGTIIEHGLQDKIDAVFSEIHKSNMSKLGDDNLPVYREDGKVIKGPNYFRPKIDCILKS